MKHQKQIQLCAYLNRCLPDWQISEVDLYNDLKPHEIADWYESKGHTYIRLLKTKHARVQTAITKDIRGSAKDSIVVGYIPYDDCGKRHGWLSAWHGYMHRHTSRCLYQHGVLQQEHRFATNCSQDQTKIAIWNVETKELQVKATRSHLIQRNNKGELIKIPFSVDTVYDHYLYVSTDVVDNSEQEAYKLVGLKVSVSPQDSQIISTTISQ